MCIIPSARFRGEFASVSGLSSPPFRLGGRKIIGNAVNVLNLPSNPAMSRRVVHKNLTSPIVILEFSSHYHRPSASQRSRPRSKVRENEPTIDLFEYPTSP